MRRSNLWISIGGFGFVLLAYTVVTSYLGDTGRYGNYQLLLFWERSRIWIQLAGMVLFLIGCVGLAAKLPAKAALFTGVALILVGLLLPLPFDGGELGVFNVHSWTGSMLAPVFALITNGAMLGFVGLVWRIQHNRVTKSRLVR